MDASTGVELAKSTEVGEYDQKLAESLDRKSRLSLVLRDRKCQGAVAACFRTIMNTGITAADFVPGIGEVVSGGADFLKVLRRSMKKVGVDPSFLDLTPDVSLRIALGSEVLEFGTGGLAPTHAIEGTMQLRKDIPRIKEGAKRFMEIWKGKRIKEATDYGANKTEINQALKVFGVKAPKV